MNAQRTRAIISKEWMDMGKNKMVLVMMALLPVLLVGMILGTAYFMERAPETDYEPGSGSSALTLPPEMAHLDPKTGTIVLMNDQYMFYLLMIPMTLPVYIAAYSIIGEKETRSLEPLLATPITTTELLVGKTIAAVVPAVLLAWLSFALTAVGMYILASPVIFAYLVRPVWTLSMAIHAPLFALLSTTSGVIASSRLNDPRAAQQVTALFIVPVIGLSMAVLMGRLYLGLELLLWATVLMVLVNVGALWLAVKLFRRETILTRWK
jgi:ABC-2 type transport system permease protein